MATLYNPLDKFQSYSIHHVMLACRTTQEGRAFTDESQNVATLAAIDQIERLGDPVPFGNKDTAFLVIDTRRFSQFAIESMKYDVLINGVEATGDPGNLATMVNMTIIDSVGVVFINFLQWLMNEKMKTNFDGMIFMHRVIFTGHNPDGTTETVQSVTIPMHLYSLEMNLDHSKGAYTAEFMPNMNFDAQRHSRWLNISTATKYFTGKGNNKLGAMINSFEAELNRASDEYYSKAQTTFQQSGRSEGKKFGRLVHYMITIPETWENLEYTGAATANATETVFKKNQKSATEKKPEEAKVGVPQDTHLAVEPGITITDVLRTMLNQVKGIAELGAGRVTPDTVTLYNFMTGITSDDDLVIVHVDVIAFDIPNVVQTTGVSEGVDKFYTVLPDGSRVPNNYAEFDYIFTGKNKDILNFDMKMQNLTFLLASNLNLGPGAVAGVEENVNSTNQTNPVDKQAELVNARAYDALLLPRNTEAELKNFSRYTDLVKSDKGKEDVAIAQDWMRNLSMFYAMSPITAIMKIRGNPDIMAKFNQNSFLPHRNASTATGTSQVSVTNTQVKREYREQLEKQILAENMHTDATGAQVAELERTDRGTFRVARTLGRDNYTKSPVFVKVNIRGPKVDLITGAQNMMDFSEEVLMNNFYTVFRVTNNIEGHVFTQDLELYSHNIFGLGKISPPDPKTP